MSWDRPFDAPVQLPNGKIALTLKDAGDFIAELPDGQHKHPKWQNAMHALIEAAEDRGHIMHAHAGMMLAIEKDLEPKRPMTNAEILAQVILDIEMALAEHLEPGQTRNAAELVDRILEIMEEAKAIQVAERVKAGFTGPHLVK